MCNTITVDIMKTGSNIKMLRSAAGLTVKDLQCELGFSTPQAIYKWQNGDCMPSIDNLVILAAVFGVTVDEILVTDEDPADDSDGIQRCSVITGISVQW